MKSGRYCDECTACCTALGVPELKKAPGVRCDKLVEALVPIRTVLGHARGFDCGIYAERPASCRNFDCLWLQGAWGPEDRPDKTGVVMGATAPAKTDGRVRLVAYEAETGAFDRPEAKAFLKKASADKVVIMVRGLKRFVVGPAAERAAMDRQLRRPVRTFDLG